MIRIKNILLVPATGLYVPHDPGKQLPLLESVKEQYHVAILHLNVINISKCAFLIIKCGTYLGMANTLTSKEAIITRISAVFMLSFSCAHEECPNLIKFTKLTFQ